MSIAELTHNGRFAVLAIDHRDSLRAVLAPDDPDSVTDHDIIALKRDLVAGLADQATGVMLEPEILHPPPAGWHAAPRRGLHRRPRGPGLHGRPRSRPRRPPGRLVAASRRRQRGRRGQTPRPLPPRPPPRRRAQEHATQAILAECRRVGIPLLVEPLFYALDDPSTRPQIVLDTVDRFAPMNPNVLKLPFPIDPHHNPDQKTWAAACAEITARCDMPWTLLSGGGDFESYHALLEVAVASGCAGFTVGRALWNEAALAPPPDRPAIITDLIAPPPRLAARVGELGRYRGRLV